MTTYLITTTDNDLENNYSAVSGPWDYLRCDDTNDVYEVEVSNTVVFEQLLDTDSSVVSYQEKIN